LFNSEHNTVLNRVVLGRGT